jgi:guanylate kinase
MAGLLFILSAPSGSGKSTLVGQLRSMVDKLSFSISWTTRAPRGSEQDGREYHFTSRARFDQMLAEDAFLEHAEVFGNCYGTPRSTLAEAAERGCDVLLDIDVQGAAQVRQKMPEAISIFILPPNPQILEMRLRNRSRAEGGVSEETVLRRLAKAREEIGQYSQYRYIIINDVLDQAVEELIAIVHAERARQQGVDAASTADAEQKRWIAIAESCRQNNVIERLRPVLASFDFPS